MTTIRMRWARTWLTLAVGAPLAMAACDMSASEESPAGGSQVGTTEWAWAASDCANTQVKDNTGKTPDLVIPWAKVSADVCTMLADKFDKSFYSANKRFTPDFTDRNTKKPASEVQYAGKGDPKQFVTTLFGNNADQVKWKQSGTNVQTMFVDYHPSDQGVAADKRARIWDTDVWVATKGGAKKLFADLNGDVSGVTEVYYTWYYNKLVIACALKEKLVPTGQSVPTDPPIPLRIVTAGPQVPGKALALSNDKVTWRDTATWSQLEACAMNESVDSKRDCAAGLAEGLKRFEGWKGNLAPTGGHPFACTVAAYAKCK